MASSIQRLLVAAAIPAFLMGCGATPPPQDNSNDGPLPKGTFIGQGECEQFLNIMGFIDESSDSSPVTLSVEAAGVRLDGQLLREGVVFQSVVGPFEETYSVTSTTETANGLSISGEYLGVWDCDNSCEFALDGICDETEFCDLGTDCGDCGPIEMTGEFSVTFRDRSGSIEYASAIDAAEINGIVIYSATCTGELD